MDAARLALLSVTAAALAVAGCATPRRSPQEPLARGETARLQREPRVPSSNAPPGDATKGEADLLFGFRRNASSLGETGHWQPLFGVDVNARPFGWPIGPEVGLSFADASDEWGRYYGDVPHSSTFEWHAGGRVTVPVFEAVRAYAGGGVEQLRLDVDEFGFAGTLESQSDWTWARYAHAGLRFGINSDITLLVDGRWIWGADVTLFGRQVDADHWQVSAGFGVEF